MYTIKNNKMDDAQYKALFVAKGYSHIPVIDYNETFLSHSYSTKFICPLNGYKNNILKYTD